MTEFEAMHMIEALRSGVSSRAVGAYFSSARPRILTDIGRALDRVRETKRPEGLAISGKYGEGKTHLLNTVFRMAHERGLAVSFVSLSKEMPFNNSFLLYKRLMQNTYLPGRAQPGFFAELESLTPGHAAVAALQEHALRDLETKKLYYVLKCFLGTESEEEKFMLQADLQGDFVGIATLRRIYKRIYSDQIRDAAFNKSRHIWDYFAFAGRLFSHLGCKGWVILVDEAELIGRLGKKARQKAYVNLARFLLPEAESSLFGVYSVFAFNASFVPDVIQAKNEYDSLAESDLPPEAAQAAGRVLDAVSEAQQLAPLTEAETREILENIQRFHETAYGWESSLDLDKMSRAAAKRGYLLRTRIRAAVELLDQLYQYGDPSEIAVGELAQTDLGGEDVPPLDGLLGQ
jgi:hypothetical protein